MSQDEVYRYTKQNGIPEHRKETYSVKVQPGFKTRVDTYAKTYGVNAGDVMEEALLLLERETCKRELDDTSPLSLISSHLGSIETLILNYVSESNERETLLLQRIEELRVSEQKMKVQLLDAYQNRDDAERRAASIEEKCKNDVARILDETRKEIDQARELARSESEGHAYAKHLAALAQEKEQDAVQKMVEMQDKVTKFEELARERDQALAGLTQINDEIASLRRSHRLELKEAVLNERMEMETRLQAAHEFWEQRCNKRQSTPDDAQPSQQ